MKDGNGAGQNPIKCSKDGIDSGHKSINAEVDYTRLRKIVEGFVEVFDKEKLPPMYTDPMVITLKDNCVPKSITVPRKVSYARREDEIKEIRKLKSDGIIEPIGDRPTEFLSPMICPIKPDGTLRFATDFTYLNKQVLCTAHTTLAAWDTVYSINSKAKYFSTFDCKKEYW